MIRRRKNRPSCWPVHSIAAGALVALAVLTPIPAWAAWFQVCRGVALIGSDPSPLIVPQGSVFRDNGRADDPLADYTGDKWQLHLETLSSVEIPGLANCTRVLVRITSDSTVRSVTAADRRRFVYMGSANILDQSLPSEVLLTTRGAVLDSVP